MTSYVQLVHFQIRIVVTFSLGRNFLTTICPYREISQKPVLVRKIEDVAEVESDICPPPLKGRRAYISTIGANPYILVHRIDDPNDKKGTIRVPIREPETGNIQGVDNDITWILCQSLQVKDYRIEVTAGNSFDYYSKKQQKWMGRTGELLDGNVDFTVGFPPAGRTAFMLLSITGYYFYNEVGHSTGHPQFVTSLFNVIRPFT